MLFILGVIAIYIVGIFLASPLIKFTNRTANCVNDLVNPKFAYLSVLTVFILIIIEAFSLLISLLIWIFSFQPFRFISNYVNHERWRKVWTSK